nr:Ig-like domain-containing protein [Clostridium ljungdahlii]
MNLYVTTNPVGGAVEYSVSDSSIATVKEDGTITGMKAGKATMICNIKDTNVIVSVEIKIMAVSHYTDKLYRIHLQ